MNMKVNNKSTKHLYWLLICGALIMPCKLRANGEGSIDATSFLTLKGQSYLQARDEFVEKRGVAFSLKKDAQEDFPCVTQALLCRVNNPEIGQRFDKWLATYLSPSSQTKSIESATDFNPSSFVPDQGSTGRIQAIRLPVVGQLGLEEREKKTWTDLLSTGSSKERLFNRYLADPIGCQVLSVYCGYVRNYENEIGGASDYLLIEAALKHPDLLDVERYLFMVCVMETVLSEQSYSSRQAYDSSAKRIAVEKLLARLVKDDQQWARLAAAKVFFDTKTQPELEHAERLLNDVSIGVRALALGNLKRYVERDDENKVSENRRKISEAMVERYAQEDIESFRQVMETEARNLFGKQEAEATIEKMKQARIRAEKEKKK